MNRRFQPVPIDAPDLPAQITEIRLPARSGRHNVRNDAEVRP